MDNALINHAQSFITSGGSPARKLAMNGMNVGALRTNDVLRKDEWIQLDETLTGIARQRLIGINDLRSRGLVTNLGGLGTLISQYEQLGDMTAADVDFSGVTDGEKDSVTFTLVSVPVPIIHKDFSINIRRLEASRGPNSIGEPIDRTQVTTAAEKVTEQMEEVLFNGFTGGALNGSSLYGYTTSTTRNTQAGSDWGTVTVPETDCINVIGQFEADKYFGPAVFYIATTQFGQLRAFHTDGSGVTALARLKTINGVDDVRPGDRLTAGTGVAVVMRRDVVDLAVGQDLTVVEWETKGGMMLNFKVMTAIAPRVKADSAGGSGICTLSGI